MGPGPRKRSKKYWRAKFLIETSRYVKRKGRIVGWANEIRGTLEVIRKSRKSRIVGWANGIMASFEVIPSIASTELFLPWLISRLPWHNPIRDNIPMIPFAAQRWLISYLKADMSVFEYGSGGSTIFISKRVKEIISVEHDKYWYHLLYNEIARKNITNCKILLRGLEPGTFGKVDYSDPESYLSSAPGYRGMNFKRYVTSIQEFPDESFDLVFIDGRARPSCIANALAKVRPGGYLMLDDSHRKHFRRAKKLLTKWRSKRFYGVAPYKPGFPETTVWKKPNKIPQRRG